MTIMINALAQTVRHQCKSVISCDVEKLEIRPFLGRPKTLSGHWLLKEDCSDNTKCYHTKLLLVLLKSGPEDDSEKNRITNP